MSKLNKIVDDLSSLTVLEAAELSKLLEEKWGVSAAAPVAAAAAAAPVAAAAEKTEFNIILKDGGTNKVAAIKAIRDVVTGLSMIDAKTLIESAPKSIKEGVDKATADKIKTALEAAGMKISVE